MRSIEGYNKFVRGLQFADPCSRVNEEQLESFEGYGKREDLEFHCISYSGNEITNDI